MLKVVWRNAEIVFDDDDFVYYSLDSREFSSSSYNEPMRVRTEFPETWLWCESSAVYRPSDTCCYLFCRVELSQMVHWRPKLYLILRCHLTTFLTQNLRTLRPFNVSLTWHFAPAEMNCYVVLVCANIFYI